MRVLEAENRDPADEVRPGTRWLLVAFLLLTFLGFNQLLVLADVADRYWAWTIHTEMTAAFLGAAYTAGFVLSVLSLRQDRWSRIRVPLLTVTAFTVLTSVATVVHAHRLHLMEGGPIARGAAWVWLAVYLIVPLLCAVVVYRQEAVPRRALAHRRPMPQWLRVLLGVEGAILFVAGAVLFGGALTVHHHMSSVGDFWPWDVTPLSSMVIGAWLIAFGLASALVIQQRDLACLSVSAVTYTVFGVLELVAVIWHWPQVSASDPWLWGYLAVLVSVVLTGGFGWRAARSVDDGEAAPAGAQGRTEVLG